MLVIIIQLAILASNRLANFTGSELQLSTSVTTTQYYITNTRRKLIRAANISLYRKAALRGVGRQFGSPAAPKSYKNGCRWALLAPLLTLWCSISTPKPYGSVLDLIKKHLDITDKPVVVEIDGHSVEELLKVGKVFTNLSDRIILKIPCSVNGIKAFSILKDEGVETFCTTVFSLTQAAAVAQAGVDHILPFCDPVRAVGGDPTQLIRECVQMFSGWTQRPIYHGCACSLSGDSACGLS